MISESRCLRKSLWIYKNATTLHKILLESKPLNIIFLVHGLAVQPVSSMKCSQHGALPA